MKKLLNYLPLHFAVFLIFGITTQFYTHFWFFDFYKLLLLDVIISCLLIFSRNRKIRTLLSWLLFFFLGISSVYINNSKNDKDFYENYRTDNSTAIFTISKVLKSGVFYDKYEVDVNQIDSYKTKGKVLLNIKKDSLGNRLQVDEKIYLKPTFKELIPPLNPHQFNYKSYLTKQGIYQQVYTEKKQYIKLRFSKITLKGIAEKIRKEIQKSLKKYHFKDDELAVINALLLGQRQDVSKELISNYSNAGAIHILAISGLHVGIILLILSTLFKPFERLRNGKIVKTILLLLFLWAFAFIAGLSASVIRAVTMFTFLVVGQSFQYKSSVEFSLISSILLLLLIKPTFLFDIGFQLSYLAVFGIVWVQPKLYKIWKPRFQITDKFWQLCTVSIAAQIGILPLSLYYFHQFPGLFLFSNLVVIPFLGIILLLGIVAIALSILGLLPQIVADGYGFIISLVNDFIRWISRQEPFLFKELSLSFLMMLFLYIVIVFGARFLIKKSPKRLLYFLTSIFFLQTVFLLEKYQRNMKQEFLIFHKSRKSILGERIGSKLFVYHNLDSFKIKEDYIIKSYKVGEDILPTYKTSHKNIFKIKNRTILVVDSLGVYQVRNLVNTIVVLQHSPKINLKRLFEVLQPNQIIADGNNYKSYVNRWRATCEEENIPFHYTGEKGAYILKE